MRRLILRKLLLDCIVGLLILSITPNLVPEVKAAPTLQSLVKAITAAPSNVTSVDVDSQGRVFIIAGTAYAAGKLYRSLDNGQTWIQIAASLSNLYPHFVKIDSRDYIYVANATYNSYNNGTLYRSIDHGESFQIVVPKGVDNLWKLTEMANGTIMANTYDISGLMKGEIWRSDDAGLNWYRWFVWDNGTIHHFHTVRANPYNNDIWITTGDTGAYVKRFRADLGQWESVTSGMFTDVMFDSNYAYLIPDTTYKMLRLPHRGNSFEMKEVIDLYSDETSGAQGVGYSMMAVNYGDIMVMGTDKSTILASIDGERWIKVLETAGSNLPPPTAWRFTCLSSRKPIYAVNFKYGLLYRLDIFKEDIAQQCGNIWINIFKRGSITDATNYEMEQVLVNGTNQLSMTNVALKDAKVTLKGLCHLKSEMVNPNNGFELGDTSGWDWTKTGNPHYAVTAEHNSGRYSLNVSMTDAEELYFQNKTTKVSVRTGERVSFGLHYKMPNEIDDQNIEFTICRVSDDAALKTTARYCAGSFWQWLGGTWLSTTSTDVYLRVRIYAPTIATSIYVDDIYCNSGQEYEVAKQAVYGGDTFCFKTHTWNYALIPAANPTLNPSVTIGDTVLSHNGSIANNTEVTESVTFPLLTGVKLVKAIIQGSGLAILRIVGTRLLSDNAVSLTGSIGQSLVYGRYKSMPSISKKVDQTILLANSVSFLSSVDLIDSPDGSGKLSFKIMSPQGTTATTLLYVGDRGKPNYITGATSWSYDTGKKMLSIVTIHSSTVSLEVSWARGGHYHKKCYARLFFQHLWNLSGSKTR